MTAQWKPSPAGGAVLQSDLASVWPSPTGNSWYFAVEGKPADPRQFANMGEAMTAALRALPAADTSALGAVGMREACLDVYVKGDWDWFSDAHDAMAGIPLPTPAQILAAAAKVLLDASSHRSPYAASMIEAITTKGGLNFYHFTEALRLIAALEASHEPA